MRAACGAGEGVCGIGLWIVVCGMDVWGVVCGVWVCVFGGCCGWGVFEGCLSGWDNRVCDRMVRG